MGKNAPRTEYQPIVSAETIHSRRNQYLQDVTSYVDSFPFVEPPATNDNPHPLDPLSPDIFPGHIAFFHHINELTTRALNEKETPLDGLLNIPKNIGINKRNKERDQLVAEINHQAEIIASTILIAMAQAHPENKAITGHLAEYQQLVAKYWDLNTREAQEYSLGNSFPSSGGNISAIGTGQEKAATLPLINQAKKPIFHDLMELGENHDLLQLIQPHLNLRNP